ncbi:MAG: endonuclease domain-containing protein [Bacteroidales bacterium]|nr:endonuclease domain-containing protein [Bacteroidales bacterium]
MGHRNETASPDRYDLLKEFAKENRNNMTPAEKILWEELRNSKTGYKFRKQHPIGDYIADFICIEKKLVIEVDGGYHNTMEQQQNDEVRTIDIEKMGYSVIRFTNDEVEKQLTTVISKIKEILYNE